MKQTATQRLPIKTECEKVWQQKNNATKIDNMMVRQEEALKTKRKTRSAQSEMSKIRNASDGVNKKKKKEKEIWKLVAGAFAAALRRRNV